MSNETALLLAVGGLAFALLYQLHLRLRDARAERDGVREQVKALTNRLLAREGISPVFTENGITQIERPIDESPFQVLKPPFAAAEERWEQEDEERRSISLAEATGAVVPELTEEQKAEMLNKYQRSY